jgi:hypothetical protein
MNGITTTTGSHDDIQKKRRADLTDEWATYHLIEEPPALDAPDLEGVVWPDHLVGRPEE